jgi:hypothetical protein
MYLVAHLIYTLILVDSESAVGKIFTKEHILGFKLFHLQLPGYVGSSMGASGVRPLILKLEPALESLGLLKY